MTSKVSSQSVELTRCQRNRVSSMDLGEPGASWEEIRRAAFVTAFVCYELDRLSAAAV